MLVGDANQRAKIGSGKKTQSCFRCYSGPNFGGDNAAPCQDANLDTEELPKGQCLGGIRSNILYPTCWDGVNLDSPDHKSHVAYPTAGPQQFTGSSTGGACPSTHPVKSEYSSSYSFLFQAVLGGWRLGFHFKCCSTSHNLFPPSFPTILLLELAILTPISPPVPQIMLEIVWDTTKFNNKAEWPADGSQPFVLSTGDNTGYGQHGDYVFGWKADSLQKAMDSGAGCMGAACGGLKTQTIDPANKCKVTRKYPSEDYEGCKFFFCNSLMVFSDCL